VTVDNIENPQNKAFLTSTTADEFWTIECLVDKLFLRLAEVKEKVSNNGKEIHVRKYYCRAREVIKWIPISKPPPAFIIVISDLTPRIIEEFQSVTDEATRTYIVTQAIGRIFENLDFEYYHLSIARNLRVRFEK